MDYEFKDRRFLSLSFSPFPSIPSSLSLSLSVLFSSLPPFLYIIHSLNTTDLKI